MKDTTEMGSGAMTCISSFIKISIQKLIGWINIEKHILMGGAYEVYR
jgi:hypothetical protein